MAFGYPVLLELAGRRAVVIGELAVEAGKVEGLLVAGAEVTVVAKGPEATLDRLATDPRVTVHRWGYRGPADLVSRAAVGLDEPPTWAGPVIGPEIAAAETYAVTA